MVLDIIRTYWQLLNPAMNVTIIYGCFYLQFSANSNCINRRYLHILRHKFNARISII